ncbi:alpha-galactosidase [Streptomyces oceani]|uniref:alpha-galactosidase n=1 Tax=Streptomyces oceani TaxID=1075402 RepID=A0A1E7KIX1_9ACTN|nr:alpha-galactosidase [Streptomyces oceani]OEV03855.1 alpha-galactosidase [Streptomyces oceani]
MQSTDFPHVGNGAVSLLLDARGPGLPSVLHWGAPLSASELDQAPELARALDRPVPSGGPDTAVTVGTLPEHAAGFPGRPGLRGHRQDGAGWAPVFTRTELRQESAGSLVVTARDVEAGLTLVSETELDDSGLLRLRHRLRNDGPGPYTVDALEGTLPLPAQATELLDFTGRHCRERQPQRRRLHDGTWLRESRRGKPGLDATLGLLAGTTDFGFRHGEVWALHVAWSGNHVAYTQRLPEGHTLLGGGELLLPGEITLDPGAEYATPWLCAAYSERGIDGVSAAFHGWLRALHRQGGRLAGPVTLNTWEAVYFDHDLDRLRTLADTAARCGVERFVLDDGWFRGRRNDRAGLGDWYVDEDVWPDGLGPLIDHVRGLGMEFGLWVEPEMISPDSELCRAHPEWLLAPEHRAAPPARHQQVLDVARPEAYAYLLERLDTLLTRYPIGALKWDHNRDLVAAQHAGRAGVHAQTRAVYELLDTLRQRHPRVSVESCASGGGRVDLGILERTDRVWASDCNDALERQAIQRWTGVFVPPEMLGAHVGPTRAHTTGRRHGLGFRAATALFGHMGAEWDIERGASEPQRERLAAAFALYKRHRELLHGGAVVHADHPDPAAWVHGVVARDGGSALFCYAQLAMSDHAVPPRVRLPGLDPAGRYQVRLEHPAGAPRKRGREVPEWWAAGGTVLSGRLLERVGVQAPVTDPEDAWLLSLERLDGRDESFGEVPD